MAQVTLPKGTRSRTRLRGLKRSQGQEKGEVGSDDAVGKRKWEEGVAHPVQGTRRKGTLSMSRRQVRGWRR